MQTKSNLMKLKPGLRALYAIHTGLAYLQLPGPAWGSLGNKNGDKMATEFHARNRNNNEYSLSYWVLW